MLRHPLQGWDELSRPYLPGRPYQSDYYRRRWPWPLAAGAGFAAVLAYVLLRDDPDPGLSRRAWLTLALAALLLVQLSLHRASGGGRWLARVTAEYAVVALLAVLLATTAAAGVQLPAAKQPAGRPTTAATTAAGPCPSPVQVRAWLACIWRQAAQQAGNRRPPPTTKPKGHARARSPIPPDPSTRRTL